MAVCLLFLVSSFARSRYDVEMVELIWYGTTTSLRRTPHKNIKFTNSHPRKRGWRRTKQFSLREVQPPTVRPPPPRSSAFVHLTLIRERGTVVQTVLATSSCSLEMPIQYCTKLRSVLCPCSLPYGTTNLS